MKIDKLRYPKQVCYADKKYLPQFATPFDEDKENITRYARLAAEFGYPEEAQALLDEAIQFDQAMLKKFNQLLENPKSDPDEPEDLESIRALRPSGVRKMIDHLPDDYRERFLGSFLGRGAGCTLGAALEFRSLEESEDWAKYIGDEYPLKNYWSKVKNPYISRYITGMTNELTGEGMNAIPVDDDTMYSLIGLLTLEENGADFDHRGMAETWLRHIPVRGDNGSWGCYWGERNMIQNLRNGLPVEKAGYYLNTHVQSVAAWTRADTWGYVAPGWPEKAAELAYRDASINHRRNGVYGTMFMAATISAAFVVNDPIEAVRIGLTEIPKDCLLSEAIRWALTLKPSDYKEAAHAVYDRYDGMFGGHAIINALFVVLGLMIGRCDFTKVIGETIAMACDNDCTGATSGSIVGAVIGKSGIPAHWYKSFNDRMQCFLMDCSDYISMDELCNRYKTQAKKICGIHG